MRRAFIGPVHSFFVVGFLSCLYVLLARLPGVVKLLGPGRILGGTCERITVRAASFSLFGGTLHALESGVISKRERRARGRRLHGFLDRAFCGPCCVTPRRSVSLTVQLSGAVGSGVKLLVRMGDAAGGNRVVSGSGLGHGTLRRLLLCCLGRHIGGGGGSVGCLVTAGVRRFFVFSTRRFRHGFCRGGRLHHRFRSFISKHGADGGASFFCARVTAACVRRIGSDLRCACFGLRSCRRLLSEASDDTSHGLVRLCGVFDSARLLGLSFRGSDGSLGHKFCARLLRVVNVRRHGRGGGAIVMHGTIRQHSRTSLLRGAVGRLSTRSYLHRVGNHLCKGSCRRQLFGITVRLYVA